MFFGALYITYCSKPSPVTEPMHSIDLNNNSNSAALQLMDNVLHNNDSPPPIVVDVENDLSVHTSNTNIKSTPRLAPAICSGRQFHLTVVLLWVRYKQIQNMRKQVMYLVFHFSFTRCNFYQISNPSQSSIPRWWFVLQLWLS